MALNVTVIPGVQVTTAADGTVNLELTLSIAAFDQFNALLGAILETEREILRVLSEQTGGLSVDVLNSALPIANPDPASLT